MQMSDLYSTHAETYECVTALEKASVPMLYKNSTSQVDKSKPLNVFCVWA